MACPGGCGKRKTSSGSWGTISQTFSSSSNVATKLDGQMVKVRYVKDMTGRANRAMHEVTGTTRFQQQIDGLKMKKRDGGYVINYGWMGVGQELLVLRSDVESSPHRWEIIEENVNPVDAPRINIQKPPELILAKEPAAQEKAEAKSKTLDIMVAGISTKLASQLEADGVTLEKLKKMSAEQLKAYEGVGEKRAKLILENASKL